MDDCQERDVHWRLRGPRGLYQTERPKACLAIGSTAATEVPVACEVCGCDEHLFGST